MPPLSSNQQLLLIGASRGLGFALAEEYLKRGWHVLATERVRTTSQLRNLLGTSDGRLEIETVSSGQGSIANNENGAYEVYRGSKAALNMFMRSFAARHADDPRTLLLMAPGWVRTEMGGPHARLSVEESIPNLANTIDAQAGKAGLQYLDYLGRKVPW
jgi:NAD(P)-dependent dehydrogenase (short-subunit alcohol dehydrogenase family)